MLRRETVRRMMPTAALRHSCTVGLMALLVLFAASGPSPAADKYAGEFLTHGVGARALAMGGAFVAVADDVTAGYWNPAGVADVQRPAVQLMHAETFGDVVNYDTAAFVRPIDDCAAIGLTFVRLAVDDIPFTDFYEDENRIYYNAADITWESDSEAALLVSYARGLSERLRLGGNLKLVRKSIATYTCYGIGFDLGAKYDVVRGLTVAGNIQDATTTYLAWDTKNREHILPTAKLGLAYARPIASMDGKVILAADADFRFENRLLADEYHVGSITADTHFGLEFVYHSVVAVRAGLAMSQLTAGVGLTLGDFGADYAFGRHEYLDSSHRVSATYAF